MQSSISEKYKGGVNLLRWISNNYEIWDKMGDIQGDLDIGLEEVLDTIMELRNNSLHESLLLYVVKNIGGWNYLVNEATFKCFAAKCDEIQLHNFEEELIELIKKDIELIKQGKINDVRN